MLHLREGGMIPMLRLPEGDMTLMLHLLEGGTILMLRLLEGDMTLMLRLPEEGRILILMLPHLVGRQGKKIPMPLRHAGGRRTLTPTCLRPEEAVSRILTRRHQD